MKPNPEMHPGRTAAPNASEHKAPKALIAPLLSMGVGLTIGLGFLPGWGFLVIGAAVVMAAGHIIFQSAHYRAYQIASGDRGSNTAYFVTAVIGQGILIGAITVIVLILRSLIG